MLGRCKDVTGNELIAYELTACKLASAQHDLMCWHYLLLAVLHTYIPAPLHRMGSSAHSLSRAHRFCGNREAAGSHEKEQLCRARARVSIIEIGMQEWDGAYEHALAVYFMGCSP